MQLPEKFFCAPPKTLPQNPAGQRFVSLILRMQKKRAGIWAGKRPANDQQTSSRIGVSAPQLPCPVRRWARTAAGKRPAKGKQGASKGQQCKKESRKKKKEQEERGAFLHDALCTGGTPDVPQACPRRMRRRGARPILIQWCFITAKSWYKSIRN